MKTDGWNRRNLFAELLARAEGKGALARALGPTALTSLGVGAIVGAGIFVLTGEVAALYTGPAVIFSFILAGIACAFAGLCYAEMAAMLPVAGSAYTFAYATLGETIAWIIGWDLVLEYSLGSATVAVGWSGYVQSFLRGIGVNIPPELGAAYGTKLVAVNGVWSALTETLSGDLVKRGIDIASLPTAEGLFNVPASIIILVVTVVLVIGIKESARMNNIIVGMKLVVLALFVVAGGAFLVAHPEVWRRNWREFIPPNQGEFGKFGWSGVLRGAGVIFFAYIGFDAVSAAAQEAKNPQKDMPIGILGSLALCTIIYIVVAAVLTSLVPYSQLLVPDPVAVGIDAIGYRWLAPIVKLGAIAGLTSVVLVLLLAQPRILWSMAEDGLLPPVFAKVHPRFHTPYVPTITAGIVVALVAGLTPITVLGELVSIGTLFAFALVCAGVLVLRRTQPDLKRPFRTPAVPWVPLGGIFVCVAQMASLPWETWLRLVVWMALGAVIYLGYGRRHSTLRGR